VFYSPNARASRQTLESITGDWRLVSPEQVTPESGHSKGFYLTTMEDLIADLVERNLLARTGPNKAYKGILIHSSKATSGQKDRLFSLLSCSPGSGRTTPWLASHSIRVIRRVLEAQRHGHGDAVIATAFVEGRVLVVQDANLAMHVIAADQHPLLRELTTDQLAAFTMDAAGSGLCPSHRGAGCSSAPTWGCLAAVVAPPPRSHGADRQRAEAGDRSGRRGKG
jgi:hypothetical protein